MAVSGSTAAVSGAREGSFGYPIADDIIKQIEVRGEIFAKDKKSPQDLTYIHSNAPWIMFRSGVDTPAGKVTKTYTVESEGNVPGRSIGPYTHWLLDDNSVHTYEVSTEQHSAETAKHCVLVGGVGAVREKGGYNLAAGLGELASNPAYRLSSTMGYRPIPGITGINVKSKDTWGAIMEAEISIQVWSREDLAVIDQLFFKPGMTALLEWGHSIWVDNKGTIHQADTSIPLSSDWFFTPHDFTELDQVIQERRAQFNGNYEACFGYITNFSYSFNDKGGYDCTVRMLSKSSVLEGLQIAKTCRGVEGKKSTRYHDLFTYWIEDKPPYIRKILKFKDLTMEEIQQWKAQNTAGTTSTLGGRAQRDLERAEQERQKQVAKDLPISEEEFNLLKNLNITLYKVPVKTVDYSGWHNFWHNSKDEFTNLIYITLRDLLKIIQTINNVREDPEKEGLVKFDLNSKNEYTTFAEHFSLNPYVAAVPHKPSVFENAFVLVRNEDMSTFDNRVYEDGFDPDLIGPQQASSTPILSEYYQILNIPITVNSFLGILDEIIDSETEDFSVFKVLNTVLADIQKAFGNINDFGLHYNPTDGLWSIVDRNDPKLWTDDSKSKGPGQICVSGLKTTLRKLSVNSAVSPSIANEMAIAAQAPLQQDTNLGSTEASPSIVNWNEGCINRHKISNARVKAENSVKDEKPITDNNINITFVKEDYEDFKVKVENFYKTVNDPDVRGEAGKDIGAYANQEYSNIYLQGEAIFKKIVNRDVATRTTVGSLCMGVIPVKVEMDLLGVSRFVVGTSFRVSPGILLPKYDNWGYIVTGIENRVDSAGWITHLRTQYFPVLNGKRVEPKPTNLVDSRECRDYPIGEEIIDRPASFWIGKSWSNKVKPLGITPNMKGNAAPALAESRGLFTTIPQSELPGSPRSLTCNRALVSNIKAVFAEIKRTAPNFKIEGISCRRNKNSVPGGTSRHCYGVAIDINGTTTNPWFDCRIGSSDAEPKLGAKGPVCNPSGKCKSGFKSPSGGYDPNTCIWHPGHPVVQAFKKYGWGWGGTYGDVMHFSLDGGS